MQAAQQAAPRPGRTRLILAIVGLACAGVVVFALWRLAGFAETHTASTSGDQRVNATVRGSASCSGTDTEESVSFTVDGQLHQAKLNGCGHFPGESVAVLVPASFDGNTVLAEADAAPGDSSGLSHRVAFLLLVVATAVGGACGYGLYRTRRSPARRQADKANAKANDKAKARRTRTLGRRDRSNDTGRVDVAGVSGGAGTGPAAETTSPNNRDPRDTSPPGVDWFEDSSANLAPIEVIERADRS